MTDTITIDLSPAAKGLLDHCRKTGNFVADSRASALFDVPLRVLAITMQPAVDSGLLKRVRDPSGVMGYRASVDECLRDQRNGTATAQTQVSQYQRSHAPEKSPAGPQNDSARTGLDVAIDPKSGKPVATSAKVKRAHRLPPLDLDAIPISFEPKVDGRATSQKRTWDPLFEALAAQEISSGNLPTKRLPPEYGGAVQAAANTWNKARKDGKRIRVARTSSATVVQLEQREVA